VYGLCNVCVCVCVGFIMCACFHECVGIFVIYSYVLIFTVLCVVCAVLCCALCCLVYAYLLFCLY
jgi:hypothetical protein